MYEAMASGVRAHVEMLRAVVLCVVVLQAARVCVERV